MLKAEVVKLVSGDGKFKSLVPIGSKTILVVQQNGDFWVYSANEDEESGIQLLHKYPSLLEEHYEVQRLKYSAQLDTVFVKCERCFVLLHACNLQQYDKIVDKRGIDKFWLLEKGLENGKEEMTVLFYSIKGSSKFKMLTWIDGQFRSIQELTLPTKSEVLKSTSIGDTGCVIVSSTAVYLCTYMSSELTKIEKIIKPIWSKELYDLVKELELTQTEVRVLSKSTFDDVKSILSTESPSQISRKTTLTSLWFKKTNGRSFKDIRFTFQPSDCCHPVVMDGKTEMLSKLDIRNNGLGYITILDNKRFFDRNRDFDYMQFFACRFLVINNQNTIRIVDYNQGFVFLEIFVEKEIRKVFIMSTSFLLVWTMSNDLEMYRLSVEDSLEASFTQESKSIYEYTEANQYEALQRNITFYDSILDPGVSLDIFGLAESDNIHECLDKYSFKLRDLNILFALKSYEKFETLLAVDAIKKPDDQFAQLPDLLVKRIFETFIECLAPPELVIKRCLPPTISFTIDKLSTFHTSPPSNMQPELSKKLINRCCLPYLTDIRRNLHNLQRAGPNGTISWKYRSHSIKVDLEFFQVGSTLRLDLSKLLTGIDTVLFQIYVHYNKTLVGPLIRVQNNCDFKTVEESLKSNQMFQELIDFYYNKAEHDKALQLLTHLSDYVDKNFTAQKVHEEIKNLVIDYLRKLPAQYLESIFEYTDWLLKHFKDKEYIISSIFMNDTPLCGTYNYELVYNYINKYEDSLSLTYLEYIVNIYHHKDPKIFNYLIMRYIQNIDEKIYDKKLKAILRTTSYYEPRVVLRYLSSALEGDTLNPEKVKLLKLLKIYPLRKLGEHDAALSILIDDLGNYPQSSSYGNELFASDKRLGRKILMSLFEKLLSKVDFNGWKNLHLFLIENGSKLDPISLFEKLPPDIPINNLKDFLSRRIKNSSMKKNQSRIKSNLLRVNLIECTYKSSRLSSDFVIINDDSKCYVCHKYLNIGTSEWLSLFKIGDHNVVAHYNCGRSLHGKLLTEDREFNVLPTIKTLGEYKYSQGNIS
ncbi:Vam6p Ecym_3244 [Eremothecium cymbalariae DBVPG|uniref:Vacuolar sorting protein 39/Transforming growth factor beta receptor-associated domain-containing protein n=1 Tax=Eremothecium cymbalariae (strain CBS 270.75 / DBVPG 7215 / KCTC 17166 / NRRL Y-17582) TaxID=931890 RepID=G8JRG8_ERECY|nr:Hypothetical protein Ecym_3244 [Eremothecium cymbalariae DBVPG\